MPRESRYIRGLVGEQMLWGHTEHLLATLIDTAQLGNWLFASAHSKSKVPKPKRLPRPGVVDREPGRIGGSYSVEQLHSILDGWADRPEVTFQTQEVG